MKIKQHLLDGGFIVRVRTNKEMEDVIKCFGGNVGDYNFDSYRDRTCLDNYCEVLEYADIDWYKNNHSNGDDILQYDDLWEYDLGENIDKICKLAIDKSKPQRLIKAKQDIISLILDAQLSSGKRFDEFISDLPVEDEVLIDFIFADDDYDLLLSEIFDVINYLGYEMNIIDKGGE